MSLNRALTLIKQDWVFKTIVILMILSLTVQSTIRDYDYVEDVVRLDNAVVRLEAIPIKVDSLSTQIFTLDNRIDSIYRLYATDFKMIQHSQNRIVSKVDASQIGVKFEEVSQGIAELSTLLKQVRSTAQDTARKEYDIQVKPFKE